MIWLFAVDGTDDDPGAKHYPVIVCEVCDDPIHDQGLLAWRVPEVPADQTTWPRRWQAIFLHKGRCGRAAEKTLGRLYTMELDAALSMLTRNLESPFSAHELTEWKRAQPTAGYRRHGRPDSGAHRSPAQEDWIEDDH